MHMHPLICLSREVCFLSSLLFAVQSQIRWHGYDPESAILEVIPREVYIYVCTNTV